MKTDTWIPAKPQAELTKRKWDNNTDYNRYWKNFHTNTCPQLLKKYVSYGRNSLLRTGRIILFTVVSSGAKQK